MPDRPHDLRRTAELIAGYVQAESRGAEVAGGWARALDDPEVELLLFSHAAHLAWRARLWRDLLPELWDVERPEPWGPTAPLPEPGSALAELGPLRSEARQLDALVGLYQVLLPRLLAAYDDHLGRASPVADRPVARGLRLASADVAADLREGEAVLERRSAEPGAPARAAERRAHLDALADAVGGWGAPSSPLSGT